MNSPTHAQDKQNLIFLVGMMGTGKSTIGKELAEQRKVKFIDSDSEIEKNRGASVSQIFAKKGEAYFRDLERRFIFIPESILYVTKIFPTGGSFIGSSNMFSFNYQFALSDFHSLSDVGAGGLAYYDQMRSYMELIDMKVNGLPLVTFSRRANKLYLWSDVEDGQLKAGDHICAEVYRAVPETGDVGNQDPTTILNDMFVKDYTTALIKQQWGMNLSKFEGMQLPGGVTINGRQLLEDANTELETLRERMRLEQEEPPEFLIGWGY